ncbi:hypothetical protein I302_102060 [Kwoniella bestiolae CBS 10118]|uniref:Uncharacterized protein n=1 Tax=Kwoniella bestiolae CBS 10118 TaxID=1296100 RepID=A0A1B9GE01_9TREE|nr:hypothetical protein I302_00745 [Kwoniella bestiolae CBS 10118]OCF29249.1 hypothetical protein I302_00745 [Kwoniella bestiolae CBS 10118]
MKLPYNRPWLMEISDHPSCPESVRVGVQKMLTFLWLNRIMPFQWQAPYELAAEVLERVIREIEEDEGEQSMGNGNGHGHGDGVANGNGSGDKTSPIKVIDFCSGAGGPIRKIERRINKSRKSPVPFLLSDLNPPLDQWKRTYGPPLLSSSSSAGSTQNPISYIPYSVDATNATSSNMGGILDERHLRTFFLSFHHFNEEAARSVLVDAMRGSEGICIFELQQCNLRSLFMIAMLGPLSWVLTPFTRPTIAILFFTYIIPLIPLTLLIDGSISVYRTRSISHILRLTNLASLTLQLENQDDGSKEDYEWDWEFGKRRHTWPWGEMIYIVGRKKRFDDGEDGDAGYEEGDEGEI